MKLLFKTVAVGSIIFVIIRIVQLGKQKHNSNNVDTHDNVIRNMTQPNIIFIVADDLGFNDVGYHGSFIKTPNLDKLATEGVRLENYYVQPSCSPTRGQLLSGRYGIHTGLTRVIYYGQAIGLPLDNPTLADKLREVGYATHMVGKWHVGHHKTSYLPTKRGFDSFFGILTAHSDHYTYITKYAPQDEIISGYDLMENGKPANVSMYSGVYSTTLYTNKVKDIIRDHDSHKPLFVYLPFQAVHAPIQVPDEYVQQNDHIANKKRQLFAGMVTCMDKAVGNIVNAIKERGLWDNTVLIFTTDNGGALKRGSSNFPLRGQKGSILEGGIRAVGFVRSNIIGKERAGSISKELMHVTDWFPTLINLAGGNLEGTKPIDGIDQWDTIKYGTKSHRKEILHDIQPVHENKSCLVDASIRIGYWKLIKRFKDSNPAESQFNDSSQAFLFDVLNDPAEKEDMSWKFPNTVKHMLTRLGEYHEGMVLSPYPEEDPLADPRLNNGFWAPWKD